MSQRTRMAIRLQSCAAAFLLLLAACAGGGGGSDSTARVADTPPVTNPDISLLFLGNSHTQFNDLSGMVADLVRAARPGKTVLVDVPAGFLFLDERLNDPQTLTRLNARRWSAVILQAQRYSSSGQFTYSTSEAEALVRMARNQGATPVMFPEWPRRGINETARIYDLHVGIARAAANPGLVLHDADGNHSAPAGALLAAMVIAATLTGADPTQFPFIDRRDVDAATQQRLRAAAREAVGIAPPRAFCPGDALLP